MFRSSTACVVVIHKNTLYAANLGDSGYLVYREGNIIHKSNEQVHAFNTPYQLTLLPEGLNLELFIKDKPEHADLQKVDLQSGDVILVATDGLWDNLSDEQILEVGLHLNILDSFFQALKGVNADNLQAKCNTIALIARRLSNDTSHQSPFAMKATEHGIRITGGKADDLTLIILLVT